MADIKAASSALKVAGGTNQYKRAKQRQEYRKGYNQDRGCKMGARAEPTRRAKTGQQPRSKRKCARALGRASMFAFNMQAGKQIERGFIGHQLSDDLDDLLGRHFFGDDFEDLRATFRQAGPQIGRGGSTSGTKRRRQPVGGEDNAQAER
eukprot:5149311-Pleurochrysis_carterae.AAC.2